MSSAYFPTLSGLGWPVIRKPKFFNKIFTSQNGCEVRVSYSSDPIWHITLPIDYLSQADVQTLCGFFLSRTGSFDTFLWQDPNDHHAAAVVFGTGDGSTKAFQLIRTWGGASEAVANGIAIATSGIKVDGSTVTAYTHNGSGLITFTDAPANGKAITWTGTYAYRCRFENDEAEFEEFLFQMHALKKVGFLATLGTRLGAS